MLCWTVLDWRGGSGVVGGGGEWFVRAVGFSLLLGVSLFISTYCVLATAFLVFVRTRLLTCLTVFFALGSL